MNKFMNKSFLKLKCKFCEYILVMPYEEVYFQRIDDDSGEKKKLKQFSKKS